MGAEGNLSPSLRLHRKTMRRQRLPSGFPNRDSNSSICHHVRRVSATRHVWLLMCSPTIARITVEDSNQYGWNGDISCVRPKTAAPSRIPSTSTLSSVFKFTCTRTAFFSCLKEMQYEWNGGTARKGGTLSTSFMWIKLKKANLYKKKWVLHLSWFSVRSLLMVVNSASFALTRRR